MILYSQSLVTEWRLVFWITFFVHIAEAIVFTGWASGKVQSWNEPAEVDERKELEIGVNNEI